MINGEFRVESNLFYNDLGLSHTSLPRLVSMIFSIIAKNCFNIL